MIREDTFPTVLFWAIVATLLAITFACVESGNMKNMKSEAVKRGFAEYNPTTGAWQWKESR